MLWTWSLNEPALSLTEGPHGQPIRLWGIDAPEGGQLCQRDGKPWQCGQVVRTHSTSSHPPNSNLQHPWCLSELNFTGSSPVLQSSEIGALSNLSSHLSTILAPRFIGIHTANGSSRNSRAASNSCRIGAIADDAGGDPNTAAPITITVAVTIITVSVTVAVVLATVVLATAIMATTASIMATTAITTAVVTTSAP